MEFMLQSFYLQAEIARQENTSKFTFDFSFAFKSVHLPGGGAHVQLCTLV